MKIKANHKTMLVTAAIALLIASGVVWASNNYDPVEDLIG